MESCTFGFADAWEEAWACPADILLGINAARSNRALACQAAPRWVAPAPSLLPTFSVGKCHLVLYSIFGGVPGLTGIIALPVIAVLPALIKKQRDKTLDLSG